MNPTEIAAIRVSDEAKLVVIRKKLVRRIFRNTILPCSTASTMLAKLSSESTIYEESLATSVPLCPIATPRSATFNAGASLTPSPVIPLIEPLR